MESEAAGQPIVLIKASETRLMVLVLEAQPAKAFLKLILGIFLDKGHQIQWVMNLHAQNLLMVKFIDQNIGQWKRLQRALPKLAMNVTKQPLIDAKIASPLFRFAAAFS